MIKKKSVSHSKGPSKGSLSTWILAIRPKSLSAAFVPITVGASLSYAIHKTVHLDLSLLALICSFLIQIGTNFINDALDFKKGADTHERLGFQRVTQSGLLSVKQVWWGGIITFSLAAVLSLPLLQAGGWPILVIGICSIASGYAYTGGPFPLAYRGLGDIFVLIFFGWVAVGGMYYLNSGTFDMAAVVAGTQVGLLATVLIAINNYRDHVTDRKAHKKTLVVRFGPEFARWQITFLCFLPFLGSAYWWALEHHWAAMLPLGIFPLASVVASKMRTETPSKAFNRYFAQSAALHLGFGMLLSLGLVLK